jgi:hypothetical protein
LVALLSIATYFGEHKPQGVRHACGIEGVVSKLRDGWARRRDVLEPAGPVICPSGIFVSSLISDFPKNISVAAPPKSSLAVC